MKSRNNNQDENQPEENRGNISQEGSIREVNIK